MNVIALRLGELSIALELDNDRLRSGMAAAKRELEGLPPVAQREVVKVSRVMDTEGRKAGGKLAQGINQGLIRNSPLIVAGVAGALSAGAPAVLAGASLLFGGVGIAAAAQNDEVRAAWAGLGDFMLDQVRDLAAPMTSTLTTMADRTGMAFQRMKPQIVDAVEAVTPQIDGLFESTLGMAENALPGMVRAAEQAGPAMAGLGAFLESTGTGLGEFFSIISDHSPAAGAAFAALGDIVGDLLPVLGELLGQGAELATIVLPPVAAAMGAVADAAGALGPLLPAIGAGFLAMRVSGAIGGMLGNAAEGMGRFADRTRVGSTAATRMGVAMSDMSDGIGRAGAAIPALGVVIAGIASSLSDASTEEDRWAQALMQGGAAANSAREAYAKANEEYSGTDWMRRLDEWAGFKESIEDANAAMEEHLNSLSPLAEAQARAAIAQEDYTWAVQEFGQESPQARAALKDYNEASAESERQSERTELALHGVTEAMIEQANQALAAIDSSFAYQNSLNQLEDAQAELADVQSHLNDTNAETRTTTEDVERAQLALAEQNYQTALAFGQQQADMSGAAADTAEYARIVQQTALEELYRLRDAAGPEMAGALNQQIAMLEASGVSLESSAVQARATADRMRDLGLSVEQIPGQKFVQVNAPTEDQRRRLRDLGYAVTDIPGSRNVLVSADTDNARGAVESFIRNTNGRTATVTIWQQWRESGTRISGSARVGAIGGIVHAYAAGGIELSPMSGGVAQVVPPNTWRVIGDRVRDDEAYIPINQDARSHSILEQTASRMGYQLQEMAAGGQLGTSAGRTVTGSRAVVEIENYYEAAGSSARQTAEELAYIARTRG